MANVDTNVANYSLSELLDIVGIENDEIEPDMIKTKTNHLINRFKKSQPNLSFFFMDVQSQLLNYVKGLQTHVDDSDEESIELLSDEESS